MELNAKTLNLIKNSLPLEYSKGKSRAVELKIRSERHLLLHDIIEELKKESSKTEAKVIAIRTSHLSVPDLRWHYENCRRYKNEGKGAFGKCFWGALKTK